MTPSRRGAPRPRPARNPSAALLTQEQLATLKVHRFLLHQKGATVFLECADGEGVLDLSTQCVALVCWEKGWDFQRFEQETTTEAGSRSIVLLALELAAELDGGSK